MLPAPAGGRRRELRPSGSIDERAARRRETARFRQAVARPETRSSRRRRAARSSIDPLGRSSRRRPPAGAGSTRLRGRSARRRRQCREVASAAPHLDRPRCASRAASMYPRSDSLIRSCTAASRNRRFARCPAWRATRMCTAGNRPRRSRPRAWKLQPVDCHARSGEERRSAHVPALCGCHATAHRWPRTACREKSSDVRRKQGCTLSPPGASRALRARRRVGRTGPK